MRANLWIYNAPTKPCLRSKGCPRKLTPFDEELIIDFLSRYPTFSLPEMTARYEDATDREKMKRECDGEELKTEKEGFRRVRGNVGTAKNFRGNATIQSPPLCEILLPPFNYEGSAKTSLIS